jgi:long-chain acyl-CoA synthetase
MCVTTLKWSKPIWATQKHLNKAAIMAPLTENTLPQIVALQAERLASGAVAIREKALGIWQSYTWTDYFQYMKHVGSGMLSLGLKRGETVGIIVNNHPEWLFTELGAQSIGAVTLNLFTSSVSDELCLALNRIQAACVVVQDQEQADKLLEARHKLSHVRRVIYIDPTCMRTYGDDPWLLSFQELIRMGEAFDHEYPHRFSTELQRGNRDDRAVMILTSGTTGLPKLAMLSHRNLTAIAAAWIEAMAILPGENWISMSPPAWIVDQMWGMGVALMGGMTMNFPETQETVLEDFREIGPRLLISASRFWEDLASRIMVKMSDAGLVKRKFFTLAERIGHNVTALTSRNSRVPWYLNMLHRIAAMTVYRPLLDRIGCAKLRSAFTGGHPISPEVIGFFRTIGLNLKQCYGLTEAGGIFQIQPDEQVKLETVGKPLPGMQVRISDDQEVLVKSDAVFGGYYQDFQATEAAFLEGWLKTGDAGYIDKDGHLLIIGRKEEIIRDKSGHAFSPDFIETRLKFSPYIKEAVIFGEGRPYITLMVNIDFGNVGVWAEERMIPYTTYMDLSQQPTVEELILAEITRINEQMPDVMKIRKFFLLYKLLDADDEELTRTGKVRRRFVYGLYVKLIEAMYRDQTEVDVKAKVQYRDGQIGKVETRVKIISL